MIFPRDTRTVLLAIAVACSVVIDPGADVGAAGLVAVAAAEERQQREPTLVVLISVDQMRADYLDRFGAQLTGGLRTLLDGGAVFVQAHQAHAITATAPGHAAMLSGLYPRDSGIIDNTWFNPTLGGRESAAIDFSHRLVGLSVRDDGPGASPHQFRGTSLVDWLRDRDPASQSVSISRKARTAVLSAPDADHTYWFHWSGNFVTSTYYRDEVPDWVAAFNAADWIGSHAGDWWTLSRNVSEYAASRPDNAEYEPRPRGFGRVFPHPLPENRQLLGVRILMTPFMDQATLDLGRAAVDALDLGADEATDVLALGLSSTDSIGHAFGPFSREVHDQILRVDAMLGDFFAFLDEAVGLDRVLIVLTSDHGVVPLPEHSREIGAEAGRLRMADITARIDEYLAEEIGGEDWFRSYSYGWLSVDRELAAERGVDPEEVVRLARDYLRTLDEITAVFSRDELLVERDPRDELDRRVRRSFFAERSGDLYLVHPPLYLWQTGSAANHQSPYEYDSHVPLILSGPGIRPGRYVNRVEIVDLAPTLAVLLELDAPTGLPGTVRFEALQR